MSEPGLITVIRKDNGKSMRMPRAMYESLSADKRAKISVVDDALAAKDAEAPPESIAMYPALEEGGAPLMPRDASPFESTSIGAAQGFTSGLAQRGAAEAVGAMTGKAGDETAAMLGRVATMLPPQMAPFAAMLRMGLDLSGGRNVRDEAPATEMLGPAGKAMLLRHPEMQARFGGTIGGKPSSEEALAGVQETIAQAEQANPAASMTGEILGGGLQGYLGGKMLGPMLGRIPGVAPTGAAPTLGQKAARLATGTGAAMLGAGAEGGLRSAADTAAGQDVDMERVAEDAGTAALMGGGMALAMRPLAWAGRKGLNALRNPRTEAGLRLSQLETSGGKMGIGGPHAGPDADKLAESQLGDVYEQTKLPAGQQSMVGVEAPGRSLARKAAPKVAVALREAEQKLEETLGRENREFYRTIAGQTRVRPANTVAALEKLIGETEEEVIGKGAKGVRTRSLPWVRNDTLKETLKRFQDFDTLDAKQMDEALAGLSREINYARAAKTADSRLENLYRAMKEDMKRFDEIDSFVNIATKDGLPPEAIGEAAGKIGRGELPGPEVPEGTGRWVSTKTRHGRQLTKMEGHRVALSIPGRHITEDILQVPEIINRNVTDVLTNFSTDNDVPLVKMAKELGIEDLIRPVRAEAAASAISGMQPRLIANTSGAGTAVGSMRAVALRATPLARFIANLSDAQEQAATGMFLGTQAERAESIVGDTPRNTVDFLMRLRESERRKKKAKESEQ